MGKLDPDPILTKRRIDEALKVLTALDLPREQINERSALALLALLGLKPEMPWKNAAEPLIGITPMMEFFRVQYGKSYKPNTRETVRRFTVHQFVQAALVMLNPDKPDRPVNSPKTVYQVEPQALALLRTFGSKSWLKKLAEYSEVRRSLRERYAAERKRNLIPVIYKASAEELFLSAGGQNVLVKKIVEEFCGQFTPGATLLYVGDAGEKWAVFDEEKLSALGVNIDSHGKMPDVLVYVEEKQWLVLIEAVTSHGPVNAKRHEELKKLFADAKVGIVFVTAFLDRPSMNKYLQEIAWETEVWIAEAPTHLIHFDGERFLGPYATP